MGREPARQGRGFAGSREQPCLLSHGGSRRFHHCGRGRHVARRERSVHLSFRAFCGMRVACPPRVCRFGRPLVLFADRLGEQESFRRHSRRPRLRRKLFRGRNGVVAPHDRGSSGDTGRRCARIGFHPLLSATGDGQDECVFRPELFQVLFLESHRAGFP